MLKNKFKLLISLLSLSLIIPLLSACSSLIDVSIESFLNYFSNYDAYKELDIDTFEVDLNNLNSNISIDYDHDNGYFYISEPSFVFDTAVLIYQCNDFGNIFIDDYPYMNINSETTQYYIDIFGRITLLQLQGQAINLASQIKLLDEKYVSIKSDGDLYYITSTDMNNSFQAIIDISNYLLISYKPTLKSKASINVKINQIVSKIDKPSKTIDNSLITKDTILNMIDAFEIDSTMTCINKVDYSKNFSNGDYIYMQLDKNDNYYHYIESINSYKKEKLLLNYGNYFRYYEFNNNVLNMTYYDLTSGISLLNDLFLNTYNELYLGSISNIDILKQTYKNVRTTIHSNSITFQAEANESLFPLDISITLGSLMIRRYSNYISNLDTGYKLDTTLFVRYNNEANFEKLNNILS